MRKKHSQCWHDSEQHERRSSKARRKGDWLALEPENLPSSPVLPYFSLCFIPARILVDMKEHDCRRPYLATECDDVRACERWRRQILSELTKLVALIQNAGLGEFRIRDMNDDINKKLREKGHWEDRIKALGGPDYRVCPPSESAIPVSSQLALFCLPNSLTFWGARMYFVEENWSKDAGP